ncbi:DNA polymerase family B [Staphylococcus caledonicus]
MYYLPKPKMDIAEQFNIDPKSYTFKQFASQQLAKIEHHYFAADFECTTEEPYTVYMVTIEDIKTHEQWFYHNIDEFLMFCEYHPNSTFYFHNGNNYDSEFIKNKVLRKDCDWHLSNKSGETTITKLLNELEVTEKGTKIKTKNGEPKYLKALIRFRDTRDIVSGSISSIGSQIGVEKGLGEIDTPLVAYIKDNDYWIEQTNVEGEYDLVYHDTNYKVDFLKNGWWIYAMQDTHILAEIIRYYKITEHADNKEYTAAKISYNEMLNIHQPYRDQVKQLRQEVNQSKKENKNIDDPTIIAESFAEKMKHYNRFAKEAYKGGIAWVNYVYRKLLIEGVHGYHLDYNSMYPSIYMQSDKYPLPKNIPTDKVTDLYIIKFKRLSAKCKPDKFPLIKNRTETIDGTTLKGLNARHYMNKLADVDISLTSVEHQYLKENYTDIEFDEYEVYFYERDTNLENALRKHGEKWYALKEKHDREKNKGAKLYDKMMLNSVYGYLGFFSKLVKTYEYKLDEETGTTLQILRQDEGGKSAKAELGMDYAEVPAAAFITAYGRVKLATDINKIGVQNVVATDTDSLFVINKTLDELNQLVEIDPYKLGALAIEHEFGKIRAIKAKTWCISDDLKQAQDYPDDYAKADPYQPIAQATAGSNFKFPDIRMFEPGSIIFSKQTYRGPGGVGLEQVQKRLGEGSIQFEEETL